jgi:hypothetical protein
MVNSLGQAYTLNESGLGCSLFTTSDSGYAKSYFIYNDFVLTGPFATLHANFLNFMSIIHFVILLFPLIMVFVLQCFHTGGLFFNGKVTENAMH